MTVCLRDKGLYSAERNYDIFAFIFGAEGGVSGFLFVLLGDVYVYGASVQ